MADELRRCEQPVLPESVVPVIRFLADDADWQVRQDVAALLLYVPEEDFPALAGKLAADANGYVRRSAERSCERRRKAELEARRASRGIEQLSEQYERLTKLVGGNVADKAIELAEKRFTLLTEALLHDLLHILASTKPQARALVKRLADGDASLLPTAVKLSEDLGFLEQYMREFEAYTKALPPQRHVEWIAEVVRRGVQQAQRGLEEQEFDLTPVTLNDVGVSDIRVEVSLGLVAQAVANIVTNAYEAFLDSEGRLRGGLIEISTGRTGDMVTLEVRDDGCGLSEGELKALRAFLPGRKNSNKKHSKGLGLLTAKKNVEAHDGTLAVESKLREGTTVTIMLPLTAGEPENGQGAGS